MGFRVFVFSWTFCGVLGASLPPVPQRVEGVLISGLTQRERFEFDLGELRGCQLASSVYKCEISKTKFSLVDPNGRPIEFTLGELIALFVNGKAPHWQFTLWGNHKETVHGQAVSSKVKLVLWHLEGAPKQIKGYVQLYEFGVSVPLQGTAKLP